MCRHGNATESRPTEKLKTPDAQTERPANCSGISDIRSPLTEEIMINRIGIIACAAVLLASTEARAQNPIELGIDAGVSIGLGDNSVTVINIPAQAFRIGFFFDDNMSLEPKLALNTITGSGNTFTSYLFELGLLYHFYREGYGRRVYPPPAFRSAFYVRPFAGIVGASGGGLYTS